jgi:GTPase SAR1 family protein
LEKIPPTIGLNIAKITKSQGEFIFWDVGGQKSLRKIWGKYFSECNGVVFLLDGSDESRFEEVKEVIDSLYTRKVLDEAGIPKIQKGDSAIFEDDMESGGGADEDQSIYQILQALPVLFLLNKNDK